MKKNLIISALAAIAAQNPEGYTVNAATLQPMTSGYAVALAVTQDSFGAEGLAKVVDVIAKMQNQGEASRFDGLAFGGWYDSKSGRYYYDATVIVKDRAEALELARVNGQLAIFDLDNLEEIRLDD